MLNFIMLMGAPGGGSQSANPMAMWLPIILIFAIMYFLIFRPQAKKQKQQRMMIESLQKGDNIVTVGGIYGTIVGLKEKDNTIIVKISENTKVELSRGSVAKVMGKE